ncbi:MAG: polyprenol phosphomannose-dependent alpha 1,6 mannosyltransferase MptB [Actinoplanes sp.]
MIHSSRCRAHTRPTLPGCRKVAARHGRVHAMPRPALLRYVGLAGSLFLAAAAWLGGASSPWEPTVTPRTILAGTDGVLLPVCWLLGTVLLIGAWWFGRLVVPSTRWAYVTAALWAVPLLPFLPLGSYDAYSYACQGWQLAAGLDPYGGGVDLLGCPWREAVAPTWLESPAPYGPVFLVLAAAAAKIGGSLTGTLVALRIIAVLGVLLMAVCLPVLAKRSGVPPRRAVWLVLACPLVLIHLVSGAHNDAVMFGFLLAGLVIAPRRMWAAGLLLGLAVGVKATAIVVVPFVVLLAAPRLWRAAAEVAAGLVAALAAVSVASGLGLGWVTGLTGSGISVQWTSPPTAVGMTVALFGWDAVPAARIVGIVALAVVLVVLWLRARPAPLRYAGYALAATVVLAPVFHPWYAIWPLAVLAATLPRDTKWLVAPVAVASALCLPDGYNLALAVKTQGAVLMTAFVIYLAGKAIHEAKNRDPRRAGAAHAPDRLSRPDA